MNSQSAVPKNEMKTPEQRQPEDAVLIFDSVSKTFRAAGRTVQALNKASARVKKGVVTGLIGPDGAGKTTLMRIVAGLLKPDEGTVTALGFDCGKESLKVQSSIRYMPQRFGLYEDLTVQENLNLYANLQGLVPKDRPARYAELMRMTGMARFTKRLARDLSGGMKQKLGLACALARPAPLLLLDEATVGVDPVSRRELWTIVYQAVEKEGMSVLLSTAYLDEAERCEEVILIHGGEILGQGPPGDFTERAKGRSFRASDPGMRNRALQQKMLDVPGVVDAILQGEGVRVVMDQAREPRRETLPAGLENTVFKSVSPRFEDSFIAMIKERTGAETPASSFIDSMPAASTNGENEVITVQDVKRRFGSFYAVRGISFSVRRGEVFGLLGANGAGKSTTFRMLCGLLPPTEGALSVAGQDLRRAAPKARGRIGYMAQRFSLYANLSVRENLRFFSAAYGLRGKTQRERLEWALEAFELSDFAQSRSGDLPLGYKQRLALAATLMHQPEIIFLDEPTSGVDPVARREFWYRISALAEQGVTALVTTHFMEEAEYCDRVVIMAEGEILADGAPKEMKKRFQSSELPEPTMEDAFIGLIEEHERTRKGTQN